MKNEPKKFVVYLLFGIIIWTLIAEYVTGYKFISQIRQTGKKLYDYSDHQIKEKFTKNTKHSNFRNIENLIIDRVKINNNLPNITNFSSVYQKLAIRNQKRLDNLSKNCQIYRKYESVSSRNINYFYLYKSLILLNDEIINYAHEFDLQQDFNQFAKNLTQFDNFVTDLKNQPKKPLIAHCVPPKTGTTHWQILINALYRQSSVDESKLLKDRLKDDFYNLLPKIGSDVRSSRVLEDTGKNYVLHTFNSKTDRYIQSAVSLQLFLQKFQESSKSSTPAQTRQNLIHLNIRHPFSRIYSAYRSKFTIGHPEIYKIFEKYITKCELYDQQHPETKLLKPENRYCSFPAFLQVLLKDILNINDLLAGKVNEHFVPITYYCSPCDVPYNFISKQETSTSDSRLLLRYLSEFYKNQGYLDFAKGLMDQDLFYLKGRYMVGDSERSGPNQNNKITDLQLLQLFISEEKQKQNTNSKNSTEINEEMKLLLQYYKNIDSEMIRQLYRIFYWDFKLFDYNVDLFLAQSIDL